MEEYLPLDKDTSSLVFVEKLIPVSQVKDFVFTGMKFKDTSNPLFRIEPALDTKLKKGMLKVSGTFYNPADVREALVEVTVIPVDTS